MQNNKDFEPVTLVTVTKNSDHICCEHPEDHEFGWVQVIVLLAALIGGFTEGYLIARSLDRAWKGKSIF